MSRVETLVSFFGERRSRPAPAAPTSPQLTPEEAALVAEACSKSSVVWVRPLEQERLQLAWQVWHEGAVHVVYGVGEQMLPLLSGAAEVAVPSKDSGARLVTFLAQGRVLSPGTPEWDAAATALAAARLNTEQPAGQRDRWAQGCLVTRLEPIQVTGKGAGEPDAPSQAAPPPPTAWTTTTRRPWHLGGRGGRARRMQDQLDRE